MRFIANDANFQRRTPHFHSLLCVSARIMDTVRGRLIRWPSFLRAFLSSCFELRHERGPPTRHAGDSWDSQPHDRASKVYFYPLRNRIFYQSRGRSYSNGPIIFGLDTNFSLQRLSFSVVSGAFEVYYKGIPLRKSEPPEKQTRFSGPYTTINHTQRSAPYTTIA